ncbi:MAG: DUF2520 domain-containing protein [Proteobacteria bacterium]|nr:DUF2520 domain-containing protein [Pseudomonadota bacterium]
MRLSIAHPDNRIMRLSTLNVIGAGRVGPVLARLWQQAGVLRVQGVAARHLVSAQNATAFIGSGLACTDLAELPPAELWLVAVPDDQITAVATQLAAQPHVPAAAWHCSGFLPSCALAPLAAAGWQVGSVHPALSFADRDAALAQFAGTVCAVEGDDRAFAAVSAIGGRPFALRAEAKPLYHAAAVWASNFQPVLDAVAQGLWRHIGMPPDLVAPLAQGFAQRAVDNVGQLGAQAALTGPAARGDLAVVQAEIQALAALDSDLAAAYAALSALASRLSNAAN